MENERTHSCWLNELKSAKSLEEWLINRQDAEFPHYDAQKGRSYQDCYKEVKRALLSVHDNTTIGALLESHQNLLAELNVELESLVSNSADFQTDKDELMRKLSPNNFTYLTHHGSDHVDAVIRRLHALLKRTNGGTLSAFEVFVLLCAAQVHDVGNIFGRKEHERRISEAADTIMQPIIKDTVLRNSIYKIASAHGGHGNKDTIVYLRQDDRFLEQQFRPRLLASILRFADEISDDSSRADKLMMDLKKIEPTTQSAIHHAYSTSLSSSSVESDDGHTAYVRLEYNIYEQTLTVEYQKGNGTVFLIDEIFERVRKMEYERQYCSKYFGFILPLTEIKFSISIHSEIDRTKCETLSYTLSDMGYPTHKVEIKGQYVSNNSIIKHLNEKGWEIKDDERKDQ